MRSRIKKPALLAQFLGIVFLLFLAACEAGPVPPTPTPIALGATATPLPRPTTVGAAHGPPTSIPPPDATPTSLASPSPTLAPFGEVDRNQISDEMVERTAAGFLQRLKAGDMTSAISLYLTKAAQSSPPDLPLSSTSTGDRVLQEAALQAIERKTPDSYEARGILRWGEGEQGGPATQAITLTLVYERGLWLIDAVTLGELEITASTATPGGARDTGSQPKLTGKLAFQVSSGGDIYIINTDGSGLRRLTDGLDPAWSPDGTQIAFSRWRDPWGVYIMNEDGSGERQIVNSKMKGTAWAPDGRRVVYTINVSFAEEVTICFFGRCFTLPPFSVGRMWVANLETEELLRIPVDDHAMHAPTWDPTRDRLVYAGDHGLAWVDLDTSDKGRLQGGSVWDTSPSYSPDGKQIAYMGRSHNHWEIFVMNPDGSGRKRLTQSDPDLQTPPSNVAPAWSPDGRFIIFLSERDGLWRIYVMNADGSNQRSMFGDRLDDLGIRYEFAAERVVSWTE